MERCNDRIEGTRTAEKAWNKHYGKYSRSIWDEQTITQQTITQQERRPSRVEQLKFVEQINGLVSQLS